MKHCQTGRFIVVIDNWFGIYQHGSVDSQFVLREYLGCNKTPDVARANGSCVVDLPHSLKAGSYEVRLFSADSFNRLSVSNSFSVARGRPD